MRLHRALSTFIGISMCVMWMCIGGFVGAKYATKQCNLRLSTLGKSCQKQLSQERGKCTKQLREMRREKK